MPKKKKPNFKSLQPNLRPNFTVTCLYKISHALIALPDFKPPLIGSSYNLPNKITPISMYHYCEFPITSTNNYF